MPRHHPAIRASAIVALAAPALLTAPARAGDLNPPPGAIQPTNRIQINQQTATFPITINQPGSYVLTSNITGVVGQIGIDIAADNVTIDLNGFSLIGVPGSRSGIRSLGVHTNLTVHSGVIRDWGDNGVEFTNADNCRLRDLTVTGSRLSGINTGENSVTVRCVLVNNLFRGILAFTGSTVRECSAIGNDEGITTNPGCTVTNCTARDNTDYGFSVNDGCIVRECTSTNNGTEGIRLISNAIATDNVCTGNLGAGIRTLQGDNRIERNLITDNNIGIESISCNYLADNVVHSSTTDNYAFPDCGQNNILLSEIPETIDFAATVKLAGSLTGTTGQHGITIDADNVTIDLNGFALLGVPGSLNGIESDADDNLRITNGTVQSWGADGVNLTGNNIEIDHLRVSENGNDGIFAVGSASVSSCAAYLNAGDGLQLGNDGTLTDCTARQNTGIGIQGAGAATIHNCSARDNGNIGISAAFGSTITNCGAYSNDGDGINTSIGSTVTDCASSSNVGDGIQVSGDSMVARNSADKNTGAGIHVIVGNGNRIDSNNVTDNAIGIDVDIVNNIIIRNTAAGNASNYSIVAGNAFGQIINVAATGSFISTDPWANFSY